MKNTAEAKEALLKVIMCHVGVSVVNANEVRMSCHIFLPRLDSGRYVYLSLDQLAPYVLSLTPQTVGFPHGDLRTGPTMPGLRS